MKVQSVRDYKKPDYPPEELFVYNPELLRENMPLIWKGKALVAGALIAFTMGGACADVSARQSNVKTKAVQPDPRASNPVSASAAKNSAIQEAVKQETEKRGIVAPLFNHGGGEGCFGCYAVSPPIFLSEGEARDIIDEEFRKQNIVIDEHAVPLEGDNSAIQVVFKNQSLPDKSIPPKNVTYQLSLDGYSTSGKFGYIFVSMDDAHLLVKDYPEIPTSLICYSKEAAEHLISALKTYGKYNAGVFYLPIPEEKDMKDFHCSIEGLGITTECSKHLLRLQVRDFIEWAKKNGLIKNKK